MKHITISEIINVINSTEKILINDSQIDENLTEKGLDSMTFIRIIVDLESTFDCEIPDSKLLLSEMNTVQKIYNVLKEIDDHNNNYTTFAILG